VAVVVKVCGAVGVAGVFHVLLVLMSVHSLA
jgi:hypothetical protein